MATAFGAFLDPVADKLMVSTALILLAAGPPAPLGSAAMAVPALVVIGREIAMSSLREWAASSGGGASKVRTDCERGNDCLLLTSDAASIPPVVRCCRQSPACQCRCSCMMFSGV